MKKTQKDKLLEQIKNLILDYKKESDSLPLCSSTQSRKEGIAIGLQMAYDLLNENKKEH